MAKSRPFAYNPGSQIPGTQKFGNLTVGSHDLTPDQSGVQWWNGPDEDLGYVIAQTNVDGFGNPLQPTQIPNVYGSVGFFRTDGKNNTAFINLTNAVSGQNFTTATQCKTWLESNNRWTSWGDFATEAIEAFKTRVLSSSGNFEAETNLENQLNTLGSTLFDSASLVITPNGVKTSKLYTIKPNNGAGDLTVVRNTSATRIDENGNIVNVPANVARIDYSNGSPAILVEPQMTNIWTNNNNTNGYASNLSAIKQSVVSNVFGTGIDGFQYNFIGGEAFVSSNYNIRTLDTRNLPILRLSLFIKNPSSDFFSIFFSGVEDVRFKFSTLEVSRPNNAYIKKINSNTYILYLYTNVATAQYPQVRVGFVQSLSNKATINGSCILGLGFLQGLASGSLPNYDYLPIITNTGSVTRNADVISKNGLIGISEIKETFENGTTNVISGNPTNYTMSQGRIKQVLGL